MKLLTLILAFNLGQTVETVLPQPAKFECVLPYVSGGGIVTMVSSSEEDQVVEVNIDNAYRYDIVVERNSTYSFESPSHEFFFVPIVHGGPIAFKSNQPVVAYTVLADDSVTIQCSDPAKRAKVFLGSENTGIAIVNTSTVPLVIQVFQDNVPTPVLKLTLGGKERMLGFLREAFAVKGAHSYMFVADGFGMGLAAVSYDRGTASTIPIAEHATAEILGSSTGK